MGEPWTDAVKNGMEDDTPADEVLATEVAYLWSDLSDARRSAHNGTWSMQCDWLTTRIVWLARRIGGATPWRQMPTDLILDGTYQAIMHAAGVPFEEPDMDEVRRVADIAGSSDRG